MILNLKKFNQNVDKIHFKMDTLQSALDIISHGDFLTKIDISDAYYSVPINPEHRKYLKFKFDDVLYEYAVLPNGYRDGPRRFTKLLKPPLSVLRHLQLIITAYIDDLLHVNRSMEQCKVGALVIVSLLSSLGFTINPDKCVLQPSQKIEYLGFIINTVDMTVTLTPEKIRALIDYCKWALDVDSMSIRCLAKLLGKITSSFNGVQYGPLHFRVLEHLKTEALENNKYDYEKTVHLSSEARKEIVWWIKNLPTSFNRVRRPNPSIVIATDACGYGWGGVLLQNVSGFHIQDPRVNGLFTEKELPHSINAKELMAVLFCSKILLPQVSDTHVKILSDNTTTVSAINKMGTSRSKACNSVAKKIWKFAVARNIWLSASHIPGKKNDEADEESRKMEVFTEWKLDPNLFLQACKKLDFSPDIDMFASRVNKQLDRFVSYRPDPDCIHVNAFSISWERQKIYCFPPFNCVAKVLQKVRTDRCIALVVVPNWPSQPWFPVFQNMLVKPPLYFSPSSSMLKLPNQPQLDHPLYKSLTLVAGLIRE